MSKLNTQSFQVPEDQPSLRLDRYLAEQLPDMSRNRVKSLILDGSVTIEGETISNASAKVKPGQWITLTIPDNEELTVLAEDIPLHIVFEDDHLIVIDKPAGMVVHPAPGNESGTLVNALLFHCGDNLPGIGGVKRPGIVHRIDKDTSGLLVVAKSEIAHHSLSEQFANHSLTRAYQAIVWGLPSPKNGSIETHIGRSPMDRKRMAVVPAAKGKYALTHFEMLRQFGLHSALMECRLETGRTHQIRVHLTHMGHPLMGDQTYGRVTKNRLRALPQNNIDEIRNFPRQALHAYLLGFDHPMTGEYMEFTSSLPDDLKHLIVLLTASV